LSLTKNSAIEVYFSYEDIKDSRRRRTFNR